MIRRSGIFQILSDVLREVAVKFVPCEDLLDFAQRHGGRIDEVLARVIMQQATQAAYMSCQRGVLHRDIKQENLLINKDTLEVKLIDFGCGDLLQSMAYTTFMGTPMYCPPEFLSQGKYHGEPATVYSLGVLLFSLICGTFPDSHDKIMIDLNRWFIAGLSQGHKYEDNCHIVAMFPVTASPCLVMYRWLIICFGLAPFTSLQAPKKINRVR